MRVAEGEDDDFVGAGEFSDEVAEGGDAPVLFTKPALKPGTTNAIFMADPMSAEC
ncbi:MAG: hypothetical protein U0232_13595 [Thermomicrobiales bacterium]